jgi:hypothetical protein
MNGKVYNISISEEAIIKSYLKCKDSMVHTDAPTEEDMCKVRRHLVGTGSLDIISLNWLRNKIVVLRKAGKLNAN